MIPRPSNAAQRVAPVLALLLFAHTAIPRTASGVAIGVDCRRPFVFPGADANVVFLPFGYTPRGFSQAPLGDGARDLARVLQLDAMISLSSIGNIASIQLDGDGADPQCGPEPVFDALNGHGPADPPLERGKGLIEIWGLVTEDDEEVSIQTFLKFARRDASEDLKVTANQHDFVLSPSDQFISFSPRSMSPQDLAAIRRARVESAVLYERPDMTSHSTPIGGPANSPHAVSFQIQEVRPPWLHVTTITRGMPRDGWILAPSQNGRTLSDLMPELHLIRLIAAYLRDRVQADGGKAPSPFLLKVAETSLASFEKAAHGDEDTGALAIGQQLLGMMYERRAGANASASLRRAQDLFDRAADRLSASAIAQSNSAVSSLRGTPDAAASPIEPDIARRLERSVALDPSDSKRLDNLESFYRWSPGVANAAHLQNVQRIRARLPFAPLEDRSPQAPGNHLQQEPGLVAPVLKPPGPGAVDVNRASLEELEAVPGVTHEIAQRIVSGRPYRSWDDLARRLGVEPASLAKMKTALRIDRP